LVTIVLVGALAMFATACVDLRWTEAIGGVSYPWFEEMMGRSIFEGEGFGANDTVILLLVGSIVVYYMGWRIPANRKWVLWRPQTGFILVSAVTSAVYVVHALKWVIGRARPDLVLHQGLPFSHWFTFGPHFISDGVFHGAFPSGHTSQMFILMTLAYVLAGDPLLPKQIRRIGLSWSVVALIASLAMGLARCMTHSHWLTDIVGSMFLSWFIIHLLYFHILRVPDQRRFLAANEESPAVPGAWEIIFCIHLLVGVLGATVIILGIRAMFIQKGVILAWLIPIGLVGLWFAMKRSAELISQIRNAHRIKKKKYP
jgi:membrane-associated phospholipid phosphatase